MNETRDQLPTQHPAARAPRGHPRRTWIAAGLALTVLALLAIRWIGRERAHEPADVSFEPRVRTAPAEPVLRGIGGSSPVAVAGEEEQAAEEPTHVVAVLDDSGHPLAGARVRILRPSFSMFGGGLVTEAEAVTDAVGNAAIPRRGKTLVIPAPIGERDPDAGIFEVSVLPPPGRPDLAPLAGVGWPSATDVLRLPTGGWITGFVVDPTGRGLAHVVVEADRGRQQSDRTDATGSFRIPHLPQGEHELRVRVPGLPSATGRRWPVSTGTHDVQLVVDAGVSLLVQIPKWEAAKDGDRLRIAVAQSAPGRPVRPRDVDLDDSSITIHGLNPDATYTMYLPPGRAGRLGWASSVRGSAGTIRLTMQPGLELEGRLELPDGIRIHQVRLEARLDGMRFPGQVRMGSEAQGRWRLDDLPSADVEIFGWTGDPDAPTASGSVFARPDEVSVLRLTQVR